MADPAAAALAATEPLQPSGTCMMGPSAKSMAALDHELRVHGLSGLRVAVASIMPTVVSGNSNAAS